jgi:hypothetical protein
MAHLYSEMQRESRMTGVINVFGLTAGGILLPPSCSELNYSISRLVHPLSVFVWVTARLTYHVIL